MKKIMLVAIAAVFAIGFSAFTSQRVSDAYYFTNGHYEAVPEGTDICPEAPGVQCQTTVDNMANTPIFKDQLGNPLYRASEPGFANDAVDGRPLFFNQVTNQYEEVPENTDYCAEGLSDQCLATVNGVPNTPLWKDAGITPYRKQ